MKKPQSKRLIILCVLALVFFQSQILCAQQLKKEPEKADVRVLIDISGSMRANDPKNLRRPALRMLVGLLQPGTRAGVWTFAKWVNMLVPLAEVDGDWKQQATSLSHKIASPGQFTNIEEVLKKSIGDWEGSTSRYRRHIVLLTDGMVDVSKKAGENSASRKRILEKLLPKIKSFGAQIHTIALSERADHDLLKRLAGDTGGWYKQTNTAAELQKLFLRIFEKVGQPDIVPLTGNSFRIDKSIKEVTILVFRASGSKSAQLITPSKQEMTAEKPITGVSWHEDTGYDLITISQPEPGEWLLDAEVDPSNRVMVVTDLKLSVSALPNKLAVSDVVNVTAALNSDGKRVTKKKFLKLVKVNAVSESDQGKVKQAINDNGKSGDDKANDGGYSFEYSEQLPLGEVELLIEAKSKTFERQKRHLFAVVEPAVLSLIDDDKSAVLTLASGVMQEQGLEINMWQEVDGNKQPLLRQPGAEEGSWQATLVKNDAPVYASIEGSTLIGNLLQLQYGPVYPKGATPVPVQEKKPEPVAPPKTEPEAEIEPEAVEEVVEEMPVAEEEDSLMTMLLFGGVNLLLFGGGFFIWWYLRKKNKDDDLSLEDEIPEVPVEDAEMPELDADLDLDAVSEENEVGDAEGDKK